MKPLGKALKTSNFNKEQAYKDVKNAFKTYRWIPHPNTDIHPADMMFRDGIRGGFPIKRSSDIQMEQAREMDVELKQASEESVISSKYRMESNFQV